jgi:hypothetical protein
MTQRQSSSNEATTHPFSVAHVLFELALVHAAVDIRHYPEPGTAISAAAAAVVVVGKGGDVM